MATIDLTDDRFQNEVLEADRPVVVDFWAEWCGPCKMIDPLLTEIADEMAGQITVAKMNIDDHPNAASRYGVRGLPTLMLFKGGEVAATKIGAMSKGQIKQWVESEM